MATAAILAATLSHDAQERTAATQQLEQQLASDASAYFRALADVLTAAEDTVPAHIRSSANLAFKNALTAREAHRQEQYAQRWLAQSEQVRTELKDKILSALGAPERTVRTNAAQLVASIAAIELPQNAWPGLIPALLERSAPGQDPKIRQAALQTTGYVCESVPSVVLEKQSNEILTAVVQGAVKDEQDLDVQLAAVTALYNSLEFIRDNFSRDGERNYIMQVVCEATQSPSADVQVIAFECLVRIMQLYYDFMKLYMEKALFGLTVLGMKHANESVALQAIEFWSTVCEEEIELSMDAQDAAAYGEQPDRVSHFFARAATQEILPVLLMLLTKQDEDATEDEWNVSMAAATCLQLFAQCVADPVVVLVLPFVEQNIQSENWRFREASVMAFGSILDGPQDTTLGPLVVQALPALINMMHDQSLEVKDTVAWTLGRITDVMITTIDEEQQLPKLVETLITGFSAGPRVIANCCWALMNLAEQLCHSTEQTSALSRMYSGIVTSLIELSDRVSNESNARTSAYEALSSFANHAPMDCLNVMSHLTLNMVGRCEHLLSVQNQLVGVDDRNNYEEVQVSVCGVLTSIIRRLGGEIKPLSDRVMTMLLQVIQTSSKESPVLEDAFFCVGAVIAALETSFEPYLSAFLPFLLNALQSHEEYQLCGVAVGLVGDICRALGEHAAKYSQGFMEVLFNDLQSAVLHRSVKPAILSCFGDVALAIGPHFEPYLDTTMNVLRQAGSMRADPENYDLIEYINTLREAILEAYTGMISALKSGGKIELLMPHVGSMLELLHVSLSDAERTEAIIRSSIGLIGDLAEAFPNGQLKEPLSAPWVGETLKVGRTRETSPETKKVAKWAREMVKRATS